VPPVSTKHINTATACLQATTASEARPAFMHLPSTTHLSSGWREKQETHHNPANRNVRLRMLLVRCPPQSTNATSMRPWAGCRFRFSSTDWRRAQDRSRMLAAQRSDPRINTVSLTEARKPSSEDHVNPLHAPSKAAHKQEEVPSVVTTGLYGYQHRFHGTP
jgi:hypothetical protein